MLKICAIASGSNGNCYYVGNSESAILVDAGISRKQILLRMEQKNLNPSILKAIFISHEHHDHCCGAKVLSKKLGIPVYVTPNTFHNCWKPHRPANTVFFNAGDTVKIGDFFIHTFSKKHDAADPCSFRVEYKHTNVGVFTDIGESCENIKYQLNKCHILFLESNYDEEMLWNGKYPEHLKARIDSEYGHLSNNQAKKLLENHHNPSLKLVILSHISQENNTPELVLSVFEEFKNQFNIEISNRHVAGEVFDF